MGPRDLTPTKLIRNLWLRRDHRQSVAYETELERRRHDSEAVIHARQWTGLQRVLRHAAATVPYYQRLFHEAGFDAERPFSVDAFSSLPILTKTAIREAGREVVSRSFPAEKLVMKRTSGSTGVPLTVFIDHDGLHWKRACTILADERSGWRRGEPVGMIWGNPSYRKFGVKGRLRNALFDRAIHLDTLHMDASAMTRFWREMQKLRPTLLFGHAHSVALFAEVVRQKSLAVPPIKGVITTAMVLHDYQRQLIEKVFGCKVTNRYGCEEVSLIASECEYHDGLHINADGVFVEVLQDGRPVQAGQTGDVVVTDLSNFAMPLIRYRIGDRGLMAHGICGCGRATPRLASIEGREADYVLTPNGTLVSGISLTENFALLVPGLAQLQIVQEELSEFLFRMVRGPGFGPVSETMLAELVKQRFGPTVKFRCEFVDVIPSETSGKYRFCISRFAQRQQGRAA